MDPSKDNVDPNYDPCCPKKKPVPEPDTGAGSHSALGGMEMFEHKCMPGEHCNRQNDAKDYLEKHKIMELLNNLTAQLVIHMPENPRTFMMCQLKTIINARNAKSYRDLPCLFTERNLETIFGVFDPINSGFITKAQYKEAMRMIGSVAHNPRPEGYCENKISKAVFMKQAVYGLERASRTFYQKQ